MGEQAIDLRLALDDALWRLGDWGRLLAALREAEALAERLGDQRRLAQSPASWPMGAGFWATMSVRSGRANGLSPWPLPLGIRAPGRSEHPVGVDLLPPRGLWAGDCGAPTDDHAPARHSHRKRPTALTLPAVWPWSWLLGVSLAGRRLCRRTCDGCRRPRLAEATEHPFSLAVATFGVGQLALRQGDFSQAMAVFDGVWPCASATTSAPGSPHLAARVGYAYALAGRLPEALPLLEQAVGQYAACAWESSQRPL